MMRPLAASLLASAAGLSASAETGVTHPEAFSLWKAPPGIFETAQSWLDESSVAIDAGRAEYWILKIEWSNTWSPNGDYAGIWQRISSDCAGTSDTVLSTIAVNTGNYEVMREDKPGQPLILSAGSGEFANIRKSACTPGTEPDQTLRATIFARAVIWTREPDDWTKDNSAQ